MDKPRFSRRAFLSRTGTVTGGVISLGVLGTAGKALTRQASKPPREFVSFTQHQGLTIEAMAERIMPADEQSPGATDAHVIDYIDRSLAAHNAEDKPNYLTGIDLMDKASETAYGKPFVDLTVDQQVELMTAMDKREPPPGWTDTALSSQTFLRLVIEHTMEGMFADPQYGGNYNETGWKMVNFPGPKAFGYDPPFGAYDANIPEIDYSPFVPYKGPGKQGKPSKKR